jgi:hypothetical protein
MANTDNNESAEHILLHKTLSSLGTNKGLFIKAGNIF